ncbi:hypothetical protein QFZ32_008817 [Streptomyces canus]|nr:hypothetical protein [Streptomyces canus]
MTIPHSRKSWPNAAGARLVGLVDQVDDVVHHALAIWPRDGPARPKERGIVTSCGLTGQWTHWPARDPPGIRTTSLVLENALLAVPDRHPLAQLEYVPLDNLRGQVWAGCPPGTRSANNLTGSRTFSCSR